MLAFATQCVVTAASWLYHCVHLELYTLIKPIMAVRGAGSRVWLRYDGQLCTSCGLMVGCV